MPYNVVKINFTLYIIYVKKAVVFLNLKLFVVKLFKL